MSCSLNLLLLLACWAPLYLAANLNDIFYGNALLNTTFLSEHPIVTEYNGDTVARFDGYAKSGQKNTQQVMFDGPANHDYTLIVELHMTTTHTMDHAYDQSGFCFIARNQDDDADDSDDVYLNPPTDQCSGGAVQYGDWHSQCISNMNHLSGMDTIQLVSLENETFIYVNEQLIYAHDDDTVDSQFGFGCVSAVAFVRRFEWIIHGLTTVAPHASKTISTSSNVENANRTVDVHTDSENDTFFDVIASWKLLFIAVPIVVCCAMLLAGHLAYHRWYAKGEYFAFNEQGPLRTVNAVNV